MSMTRNLDKKNNYYGIIAIFIAIFVLISGIGIYTNFANKEKTENVIEKSIKYDAIEGDFGVWETSTYLDSTSNNIEIDYNYFVYYNNTDPLAANEITLHFNTYVVENNISSIAAGKMVYHVSAPSLFFYADDFHLYAINEAENKVSILDNEGESGYIKFGSDLPYCHFALSGDVSSCSGNSDYYWDYDSSGLMIINGNDITDLDSYSIDLAITYSIDSSYEYISGYSDTYCSLELLDYDYTYYYSSIGATVMDRIDNIDISNIHNGEEVVYTSWQSKWGTQTTNYDHYLYYPVTGYIDYSDSYFFDVIFYDEYNVVAYSGDDETYYTGDIYDFLDSGVCAVNGTGYSDVGCYFIVGYNVPQDMEVYFQVYINVNTNYESLSANFEWNTELTGGGVIVEPEYPQGISDSYTLRNSTPFVSEGAINKLEKGSSVNYTWLIESGTGNITNGYKAFNLWNLTNKGVDDYTVELATTGQEIDQSYGTVVNPYSLNGTDYSIVSFYPQNDYEYDYVLNSDNNYQLVLVQDTNEYTPKDVYVSINDGEYEKIGSYVSNGGYIEYTAIDTRTTNNSNVTENNPIVLPENVTKLKVTYTGVRPAVYIGYNFNTVVNGTTSVNDKISSLEDLVVLKDIGTITVNNDSRDTRTGTYLTHINVSSHNGSRAIVGDRIDDGRTDVINYQEQFYEQVNYSDDNKDEVLEYLEEQKNGILYELLPRGAELSGSVSVKTIGDEKTCTSSSTGVDNYEGSGRTLVIVSIGECDTNYYDTGSSYMSGYDITYTVTYSALANQSYGTTLYFDTMYEAASTLGGGYNSPYEPGSSSFSSLSVIEMFGELVDGNKNLLFVTTSAEVEPMSISVGTYDKTVKGIDDDAYSDSASIAESIEYSYKLQYSFTSEMEKITNVVIIDNLENYENNGSFNGYLDSVDTSYLTNIGVNATVYYSTVPVSEDSFNASDWSTSKPVNAETIKAIAVDCGNYVFSGNSGEAPLVYVNMVAPNEYEANITAKNKSVILYQYTGDNNVRNLSTGVTSVSLEAADLSITGTSSLGTGTETNPVVISDNYGYSFTVKNNDDKYTFNNVKATIELPVGLRLGNNTDPNLSYDSSSRVVTYSIDSLTPGEEVTVEFDVEIVFDEISGDNSLFVVNYHITSLNNNSYEDEVKKLYNQLELPTLEFTKYANTTDTNGFSAESVILITKGETYQYRVAVKNTSDVAANDILVVDTVPEGLTVTNINNSGVYDGNRHTVTWNVSSLAAHQSINLEYEVKVGDDIRLGTRYRSSAHVTLVNPLSVDNNLYDEDTNLITTLYQLASDIKVENTLVGNLADSNKNFAYTAEFQGSEEDVGTYDINNASGEKIAELSLDSSGHGVYNFNLKGNEAVEFKLLPGSVSYTVRQYIADGYVVNIANGITDDGFVFINGVTDETRKVSYTFKNTYDVSTDIVLGAKVTYDFLEDDMFEVTLIGNGVDYSEINDASGNVTFDGIHYSNEIGQFVYDIKQIDTGINKILYDLRTFKAVVNVTDDGVGHLDADVTYYDADNNEVDEVIFENSYLPNGLVIQNINSSDYIDNSKEFNYELSVSSNHIVSGTYQILDNNGQEIGTLQIQDGEAEYSFSLKSNESITIVDLPDGVSYVLKQEMLEYYTVKVEGGTYTIDESNNVIITEGVTEDGNVQVKFNNNYVTYGSFSPVAKVTLEGKDLEDQEFIFMIVDVSDGMTNGYTLVEKNNSDGEIEFADIEYTRPGVYTYEITQVSTNSNHIYYDNNKILLTVTLTDNGDGTMEVLGEYKYFNEEESFINKYSEEPIVPEEPQDEAPKNPNTLDRTVLIGILFVIVLILFAVERRVRQRRFALSK